MNDILIPKVQNKEWHETQCSYVVQHTTSMCTWLFNDICLTKCTFSFEKKILYLWSSTDPAAMSSIMYYYYTRVHTPGAAIQLDSTKPTSIMHAILGLDLFSKLCT